MREPFREDEDDDAPGACSFCGAAGDAELAEAKMGGLIWVAKTCQNQSNAWT